MRHKSPSKKYLLHVCQLRSQLLKGKGREGGKERETETRRERGEMEKGRNRD